MLPTQSVVKALTVAGYPPNQMPQGLTSLPAMAAQYAKLKQLQSSPQWPVLASQLGPEVKAIQASLAQANRAMTLDAGKATALMSAAEKRLYSGRPLSGEQSNALRATAAQLEGLQANIQNTYAALRTAGLYEADRHPVATQIATWRTSLESRLKVATRSSAAASAAPAATMAAPAPITPGPAVDLRTAAVDTALQAITQWGSVARQWVSLSADATPERRKELEGQVMNAGQQLQRALVHPEVVRVMKASNADDNGTASAFAFASMAGAGFASPTPNGEDPRDNKELERRLQEALINAAGSSLGDLLEHFTGGTQASPERVVKGQLIAASLGFLMPASLSGPVKGPLVIGAVSAAETQARQTSGVDPENPSAVVASFFFAAGATAALHRLHRLVRATSSSGVEKATSVWQQELYKKVSAAKDNGEKNFVLLSAKHPNGKPQLEYFNEGSLAKIYTELGPNGEPTGRLLRLHRLHRYEAEANKAFVAASRLGLGPEIFEITPKLTVMARVPGQSGSDLIPSNFSESESKRVVAAFVERLARFHRAGWIHGDVHLDNMLFDRKAGTLKLIDFDSSTTQRDLLSSKETQRLFRVDVHRAYDEAVALFKPDGVPELAWFQDFKRAYLQALAGGADEASHTSSVHKARFDLAASKLSELERGITSGPFSLVKPAPLRGGQ